MRLEYFSKGDKVLLLGEGNFSFALSLFEKNLNIDITATCYESSVVFDNGINNINYLKNLGVRTILGIDATKLDNYFDSKLINFDRVIFNFPHVGGKMRIEKNRILLKEFFISVSKFLKQSSTVIVTLCDGQGGTPYDKRKRRRDDSWQIDEMAAYGNLLITSIEPFVFSNFSNYNCVGYRSLNKTFTNNGALVHILQITDKTIDDYINIDLKIFQNPFLTTKFYDNINIDMRNLKWEDTIDIIKSSEYFKNFLYSRSNTNLKIVALFSNKFSLHVTFQINKDFKEFYFYVEIYLLAGDFIDSVKYLYEYSLPNSDKINCTYEIVYKSYILPLYRKLAVDIHNNFIIKIIEERLNLIVSK